MEVVHAPVRTPLTGQIHGATVAIGMQLKVDATHLEVQTLAIQDLQPMRHVVLVEEVTRNFSPISFSRTFKIYS